MLSALTRRWQMLATDRRFRSLLVISILAATLVSFIYYFHRHPQYFRSLADVSPVVVLATLGMNILLLLSLIAVYDAVLRLCGHRIAWRERFLLTSYSSIINFFGPLQSGPGVRAVYLRAKHHVRIRDYTLGTLVYYGLFAAISASFLLIGTRPVWQLLAVLGIIVLGSYFIISRFQSRDKQTGQSQFRWLPSVIVWLAIATFIQVSLVSILYYIELRSLDPAITFGQAATYTGAANFALFVSLTPGAIGFREAFLYFSQQLHHVPSSVIASANVIDRGSYVVFLGLLFIVMLSLHASRKLRMTEDSPATSTPLPISKTRQPDDA